MAKRKRCKVCKSTTGVNDFGRCPLCQAAQDAVEAGISYGKLIALRQARQPQRVQELPIIPPDRARTCRWCGATFKFNGHSRAYCSDRCRKAQQDAWYRERKRAEKNQELPKKPLPERLCIICGKAFLPKVPQELTCGAECSKERKRQTERELRMEAPVVTAERGILATTSRRVLEKGKSPER